jgi:D-proline reductase (dithiol) PrdB
MARLDDIPQPTRDAVANAVCPSFETTPFVSGPTLAERRVAIVSSAALIRRNDTPLHLAARKCAFCRLMRR